METNRLYIFIIGLLFFVGCKNSQPQGTIPSVLIPENKMVEILTDIQIMESAINYKKNTNQATYDLKDKGYDTIFSHYGITDSIFFENVSFYNANTEIMYRIFDSITKRIEREQVKVLKEKELLEEKEKQEKESQEKNSDNDTE